MILPGLQPKTQAKLHPSLRQACLTFSAGLAFSGFRVAGNKES